MHFRSNRAILRVLSSNDSMVVHLFLAVALGSLAKSPLQDDTGLLQSISLSDKMVDHSYLVGQLEAASHVRFTVEKTIKDRKVTAFAQSKTVSDVMWAI